MNALLLSIGFGAFNAVLAGWHAQEKRFALAAFHGFLAAANLIAFAVVLVHP